MSNKSQLTLAQRISAILEDKEISNYALAQMLGLDKSTISRQLQGPSKVSGELLSGMLNHPDFSDVSAEYLMRGDGPMYLEEKSEGELELERKVAALEDENAKLRMSCSDLLIELTNYKHKKK